MKLKPRTTYKDRWDRLVMIAGRTTDGENNFWSIQGNHYTPEGRFLSYDRHRQRVALPAENSRTIVEEVDTPEARAWWEGVVTERKPKQGVIYGK